MVVRAMNAAPMKRLVFSSAWAKSMHIQVVVPRVRLPGRVGVPMRAASWKPERGTNGTPRYASVPPVPASGSSVGRPAASWQPSAVLVKVGDGKYLPFQADGLMGKNISEFLKALKADEVFERKFKDVDMSECTVTILKGALPAGKRLPDAADEASDQGLELEADMTVGDAVAEGGCTGKQLFFHVRVPSGLSALETAIKQDNSTMEQVYALLGAKARAAVDAARAYRANLAAVPALIGLQPATTAADAEKLGIRAIRTQVNGYMTVGMFDLPALHVPTIRVPKTYDEFASHGQKMLLLPRRLERAFEAVHAVQNGTPLGVHLSGPNGVGKSAILLLVRLLCTARGIPAVYLPRAGPLVNAAREEGGGDAYILEAFWHQNADIVIQNPELRRVFVAVMQDSERAFTPSVMAQLRRIVGSPGVPAVAVIMDEVQHITAEVKASQVEKPAVGVQCAGRYFATDWYDWTNDNAKFQRISAASAHAARDMDLPDGESHRLRIIEPLHPDDRAALQNHEDSPAYVHPAAREFVVTIAGDILRKLVTCASLLPRDRAPVQQELLSLWQTMWLDMRNDSTRWLASLPDAERSIAAREIMALLSGKVEWGAAQVLYDAGIVFRSASSAIVRPVSLLLLLFCFALRLRTTPRRARPSHPFSMGQSVASSSNARC